MVAKPYLVKLLIEKGVLPEAAVDRALALREREPLSVPECLVKSGVITASALAQALAKALGLPFACRANKLLSLEGAVGLDEFVSKEVADKHQLLPFALSDDEATLSVAMADPTDAFAVDELRSRTGLEIQLFVAPVDELAAARREFYAAAGQTPKLSPVSGIALRPNPIVVDLGDRLRAQGTGSSDNAPAREPAPAPRASAGAAKVVPPLGEGGRGAGSSQGGFFSRLFGRKEAPPGDEVDCSVYAPEHATAGARFMVQVYAHLAEAADEARAAAVEADSSATRRGVSVLGTRIVPGSSLVVELSVPGCLAEDPVQQLVWRGRTASVQFVAAVPADAAPGDVFGKVLISQSGVPIGEVRFKLSIGRTGKREQPALAGEARRYTMAFVSYASKDRDEVLRRVQMLPAAGVRFFQDVVDLVPGENWNDLLYQRIDEADVMFLFWSSASKGSDWCRKEWTYGLEKKGKDFVRPILLEGPPVPLPPQELSHLHFNDKLLYFMKAG